MAILNSNETKQQDEKIIVTKVQKRLIDLGYDPGIVDGCMGPKTTEAIRAFQSDNQMPPPGDITSELVESLGI
jgi:localization factor PodJL